MSVLYDGDLEEKKIEKQGTYSTLVVLFMHTAQVPGRPLEEAITLRPRLHHRTIAHSLVSLTAAQNKTARPFSMTPPITTSLSGGLSTVNEENVPSDAKSSSSPPKSTSATASFSASTGTATPPSSPVPDPKPDADVVITYEDALDVGRKRVKETFAKSKIGIEEKEKIFPRFHKSELTIGSVLGKGGFGTVSEIVGITVRKTDQRNSFSFRSWANITQTKGGAGNGEEDQADEAEEDIYVPDFDPEFDESAFQTKKFMEDFVVGRGSAGRYAIKVISPEVKAKPKKFIR